MNARLSPSPTSVWRNPRLVLSVLLFGGYLVVSRAVLHLFPFSIFDMYARATVSGSRVVARDAAGRVVEVDRFTDWECAEPPDVGPRRCGPEPFYFIPYKDQEAVDYIVSHRGHAQAAVPVTVVRRIWRLGSEAGDPRAEDCPLVTCRAVPR